MKTYLDCLPCLMSQALRAARAATDDEEAHRQVVSCCATSAGTHLARSLLLGDGVTAAMSAFKYVQEAGNGARIASP